MTNTKEEIRSIDDLIGTLYDKINQRDKQIETLKNELVATKDELKSVERLKKELAAAKEETKSVKKDYDYMYDRLERIADMPPRATDASRGRGFNVEKEDADIDAEIRAFMEGPRDLSDPKQLERAHCLYFIP